MNLGRNFEFRVPPYGGQRSARHALASDSAAIPIGVPILVDDSEDETTLGLTVVRLATGSQAPQPGLCGIAIYEHAPAAFAGYDPFLTTYSDIDTVPAGGAVQMVFGDTVKVCLRNTVDRTFLNTRNYEGRTMVAGMGATPTVALGDYLTPGTGNDNAGYWAETGSATNAWLVVTKVDVDRGEVEARMMF